MSRPSENGILIRIGDKTYEVSKADVLTNGGERHWTFNEAIENFAKNRTKGSWRLPTAIEAQAIIDVLTLEDGLSEFNTVRLMNRLNLSFVGKSHGFNGHLHYCIGEDSEGLWWTSTSRDYHEGLSSVSVLKISHSNIGISTVDPKETGAAVRLIREI